MEQPVAWYWTVIGLLAMGGALCGAAWWIRAMGKGKLADWLRLKWPVKGGLK
jgi:hypothetical protein